MYTYKTEAFNSEIPGLTVRFENGRYVESTMNGKVILPDDNNQSVLFLDDTAEQLLRKIELLQAAQVDRLYMCLNGSRKKSLVTARKLARRLGLRWQVADIYDQRPQTEPHIWIEFLPPACVKG